MLRLLLAFPLAFVCVFAFFLAMAYLVTPRKLNLPTTPHYYGLDVLMEEFIPKIEPRKRPLPPDPPLITQPPELPTMSSATAPVSGLTSFTLSAPLLSTKTGLVPMNFGVKSMPLDFDLPPASLPNANKGPLSPANAYATPFVRIGAVYPTKAKKRGIEGHVIMSFFVDNEGKAQDIKIVEATPKRTFERSAIEALKKWRFIANYQTKLKDQKHVKIEFRMNK